MLQDLVIDYTLLAKACEFYKFREFEQIEVPWMVTKESSQLPLVENQPDSAAFVLENGKRLVCSAEQGFIELALLGNRNAMQALVYERNYFSVSPCFRDETLDATHSKWFVKLELFTWGSREHAVQSARSFANLGQELHAFIVGLSDVVLVNTDTGIDLMRGDLELGSYGIRNLRGRNFIAYGTGLALPRAQLGRQKFYY